MGDLRCGKLRGYISYFGADAFVWSQPKAFQRMVNAQCEAPGCIFGLGDLVPAISRWQTCAYSDTPSQGEAGLTLLSDSTTLTTSQVFVHAV
jgi:hypothetical protein